MKHTLIVHLYINDHNNKEYEINTKGWTHEELAQFVINLYGETKIRHLDDYHYTLTIYTYNNADTEQIKKELQNI